MRHFPEFVFTKREEKVSPLLLKWHFVTWSEGVTLDVRPHRLPTYIVSPPRGRLHQHSVLVRCART